MTTPFKPEVVPSVILEANLPVEATSSSDSKEERRDEVSSLDDIGVVDREGPVVTRRELWSYYRTFFP